jgi:hypothetical protein
VPAEFLPGLLTRRFFSMDDHDNDDPHLSLRVAAAALGLLAGLAFGLVFAFVAGAVAPTSVLVDWVVFGTIVLGAVIGFLWPAGGMGLAQGLAHFLTGLASVAAERMLHRSADDPPWLQILLWLGVIVGVLMILL